MTRSALSPIFTLFALAAMATPAQALLVFGPPSPLNSTASTDIDTLNADDVDREVSLANDGTGNWVALWSSDNPLGGTVDGDSDIFVSRSSDDGETWSPATAAMAVAATDGTDSDSSPEVAEGAGVFVSVFSSDSTLGGTVGNDRDILFTRSTDNGATWSAPALLNSGGTTDDAFELDGQPALATDGAGRWLVVWQHNTLGGMNPTGFRVYYAYSTDGGQTWSAQQTLGGLQAGAGVGNGQGTTVVWTGTAFVAAWGSSEDLGGNGADGDILTSVISVPTFTASPAALLNDSGATDTSTESDQYPVLTANGSTVVAAWHSKADVAGAGADRDIFVSRSTDGASTWSAAAPLASNAASDTGEDSNVAMAHDGSTFLAVWDSTDPLGKLAKSDADIFVSRSEDSGLTWSEVAVLATTAAKDKGADVEPAIAVNPSTGSWALAWQSTDTLGNTIGADRDLLFVYSANDCPTLPVAAASCFESTVAGGAALIIKDNGDKDSFLWKLVKGPLVDKAADIGDPSASDDYVLCLYDEAAMIPELVSEMDIESGGNCYVKPCWSDKGTTFLFKHKAGVVSSASLGAGEPGQSKVLVKAKGAFRAPGLPLNTDTKVSVRLHNLGNGKCFAADYSAPTTNSATFFKGTSD